MRNQTIRALRISRRSACFELDCGPELCHRFSQDFEVFANGLLVGRYSTNVFALCGLAPGTSYDARALFPDGQVLAFCFKTEIESALILAADYGADASGSSDSTEALQRALDDCPDGGTVFLGAGTYLTYPLFPHSGTLLYL
ncbi:MAG: glycoside hydrolase family 28 protein, partial [Clostridiales bacterium]|nr:glycoside hydrolase family 28 protein [Clostridiales bacterium]